MSVDPSPIRSGQADSELLKELNNRISSIVQESKQDHWRTWQILESVLERIDQLQIRQDYINSASAIQTDQRREDNAANQKNTGPVNSMDNAEPFPDSIAKIGEHHCDEHRTVVSGTNAPTLQTSLEMPDPKRNEDQVELGLASQQHQAEGKLTQDVITELASLFAETNHDEPEVDDNEVDLWDHVKRKLFSDFHFTAFSDDQQESLVSADAKSASESAAAKLAKSAKSKELNDALGITVELSDEIDSMRHELEEKLRQAEIELSIQRARISNQQAKLEERQLWLEQREREMKQAAGGHGENNRWSRHIPAPRKKNES